MINSSRLTRWWPSQSKIRFGRHSNAALSVISFVGPLQNPCLHSHSHISTTTRSFCTKDHWNLIYSSRLTRWWPRQSNIRFGRPSNAALSVISLVTPLRNPCLHSHSHISTTTWSFCTKDHWNLIYSSRLTRWGPSQSKIRFGRHSNAALSVISCETPLRNPCLHSHSHISTTTWSFCTKNHWNMIYSSRLTRWWPSQSKI